MPPEMWLLPYILPLHPGRMWNHCRMVYLPMSYLYGKRFVGPVTPTVLSLRKELYTVPYGEIDWDRARNECAKDILWATLHKAVEPALMRWPGNKLRDKALRTVMMHIHYEDENTNYICLGPVNKALNLLYCWVEDQNSDAFKLHLPRIYDYLWLAEDGMKMMGYNGSQLWDTAFAVQAIISTKLGEEFGSTLRKAHSYYKALPAVERLPWKSKILVSSHFQRCMAIFNRRPWLANIRLHFRRTESQAVLLLSKLPAEIVGEPLDTNRLYDAVNVILSLQNADGGFGTYELARSYNWLELINPAETFGNIIIDYPCVDCTSAAVQALAEFKQLHHGHRREEVESCIEKGAKFIEKIQEVDGS